MARDCKGNHYFLSSKFFKKFTRRKFPHHSLKLPFATFAHRVRFPFGIQRDANIRIFSETTHNNRYFLTNLLKYNQIISYFNSFYDYYYSFQSFFSFKISFIQPDKIDRTYEGENETYIEASAENSGSILYDKEIRDKPRTRRTKRNV